MVWIVIALVLIAAIGPVFYLMPSKASRRQAALRTAARQAGLVVEVGSVPKLDADAAERVSSGGAPRDAKIDCAVYRLPLARRLVQAPQWMLLKSARENRFLDGWTTQTPPVAVPVDRAAYWREVAAIVDALPGSCVAVEAGRQTVSWYGTERIGDTDPDTLAQAIRDGLARLAKVHERIERTASRRQC